MRINASDFYLLYRPSKCDLRVYLKSQGEEESQEGPYQVALKRLGRRHEQVHLESLQPVVDLSKIDFAEREQGTREEIERGSRTVYQGVMKTTTELEGLQCEIIGQPDFLIREGDGYVIRDSKISRRINEKDHAETFRQLELYGWIYEQVLDTPPVALQVHAGSGDIVPIPYDGGLNALRDLERMVRIRKLQAEPYEPVGWAKCSDCRFRSRCWSEARKEQDVAVIPKVSQKLALALHGHDIKNMDELLAYDTETLVGTDLSVSAKRAESILREATALVSGKEIVLDSPSVPEYSNYVMFDLEGLPPQLDGPEQVCLWGLQVFGEKPGEYVAASAGFGSDGDREGWETFLSAVQRIFKEYGDLPFVHWHHYERDKVKKYIERFGDPLGIAERVCGNLLDLLPITKQSIVLPLPSYSLKVVEEYVGFKRMLDERKGDWAMAQYIEAIETEDAQRRAGIINEILDYNREDLEATWAVLQWLKAKAV